ncbi:hypothetical protein [Actinoallomurus sp. NPDC050550]|uniref:hypothetical protein n=1 Tax=Actinoallomurus sp. NPDC050550 TaxID=3154937 RepID=UPI0033DD84EC
MARLALAARDGDRLVREEDLRQLPGQFDRSALADALDHAGLLQHRRGPVLVLPGTPPGHRDRLRSCERCLA